MVDMELCNRLMDEQRSFAADFWSSTIIASVGHDVTQAIHKMQSSALTGTDFFVSGCLGRS